MLQVAFIECEVPTILMHWVTFVAAMFFLLFAEFYYKAYRKRDKLKVGPPQALRFVGSPGTMS